MSRELKFRTWDDVNQNYFYNVAIYPDNVVGVQRHNIESEILKAEYGVTHWTELGENTIIEQYTGLKDKNGKEIYEGNIVKFGCGDQTPAEVVYQDGSYFLKALDDGTLFYDPDANKPCPFGWFETYGLEVIGNIHENPELLGGEE